MPAPSPARACAHAVLRRVFEQGAWADRALRGEAERLGLGGRDLALATRLSYGAVQRRATLDHLVATFAGRPAEGIQPAALAGLRLGAFQLVYLDRVPAHAAVGESVELVKRDEPKAAGFVNALLRRTAREGRRVVAALPEQTPAQAALRHSVPPWIAELWFDAYGPERARALLAAANEPMEHALRANRLRTTPEALAAAVGGRVGGDPVPDAVLVDGAFDAHGHPAFAAGELHPQSRAAQLVGRALDPRPGERVLDLCAAPGGKTSHLAALMQDEGRLDAVELHRGRAEALERTLSRLGVTCARVVVADAAGLAQGGEPGAVAPAAYDRVLVDPPCSDLGTLSTRPDVRWRKDPGDPERLAELQGRILDAGIAALKPGGTLVYSTCTLSPQEDERVVEAALARHPGLELDRGLRDVAPAWEHPGVPGTLLTQPDRDRTDGFFIARLGKRAKVD